MTYLEGLDTLERENGTAREKRLRQIVPETGKFITLLARIAPTGRLIEIGTSAAYSTLWLSLAAKERGQKIETFENNIEKYNLALETVKVTETQEHIDINFANALEIMSTFRDIAFCFLDAEKWDYNEYYKSLIPHLVSGGILAVDNVISHYEEARPMLNRALQDPLVDSVIIPIGRGILMSRKI